jgi:hypothetical protein
MVQSLWGMELGARSSAILSCCVNASKRLCVDALIVWNVRTALLFSHWFIGLV